MKAVPRLMGVIHLYGFRCDGNKLYLMILPTPPALLSISQRSRLATDIAINAGGLLPPPFQPSPVRMNTPLAGLLSVAVLRHLSLTLQMPTLTVSCGGLPQSLIFGGEESGSSSTEKSAATTSLSHLKRIRLLILIE